jgi:glucose-6-phosphate isomerase
MPLFTITPGPFADAFDDALHRLRNLRFADALWTKRLDAWPGGADTHAVIATRLGWLDAVDFIKPQIDRLEQFTASVRDGGYTDVVLLGMGGSSLAPEVLRRSLGVAPGAPRFRMLNSTDPSEVRDALTPAATSLFILASKSGTTIEPMIMATEARRRIEAAGEPWGSRFVAITDGGSPLEAMARTNRFRDLFVNPADIGGRFSALSFFGLVPAAAMGLDLPTLLESAESMAARCRIADPATNPGLALGALMAAGALTGRDKLTLLLPAPLESLGLWIEQLVAESTGKNGSGIVPIVGEAEDAPIADDRVAVAFRSTPGGPQTLFEQRLRDRGVPVVTLQTDVTEVGGEFFRWETATATAGLLLGINPFDEPNVDQAKAATRTLLDHFNRERLLPQPEPEATVDGIGFTLSRAALAQLPSGDPFRFLEVAGASDYLALLAYVPPSSSEWRTLLERVRATAARVTGCASTMGYGPQYLHSTSQLHKGGADNGVFIVIAPPPSEDLPVPGELFSFGVLEQAQAVGDFHSLDAAGRRALFITAEHRDLARFDEQLAGLVGRKTR